MRTRVTACIGGSDAAAAVCDYAIWAAVRLGQPLAFAVVAPTDDGSMAEVGFGNEAQRQSQLSILRDLAATEERRRELVESYCVALLQAANDYVGASATVLVEDPPLSGSLGIVIDRAADTQLFVLDRHRLLQGQEDASADAAPGRYLSAISKPVLVVDAGYSHPPKHMAVMPGVAWSVISDFARQNEVDLLALGGYHYSHLRQNVRGSTIANLLRSIHVPTLVMR